MPEKNAQINAGINVGTEVGTKNPQTEPKQSWFSKLSQKLIRSKAQTTGGTMDGLPMTGSVQAQPQGSGKIQISEKNQSKTFSENSPNSQTNPLDSTNKLSPSNNSQVIKTIVSTETSEGLERILEEAPEFDTSLLQEVGVQKSPLLILLKSFFIILVLAGFASFVFFTSQLSDIFDFASSALGVQNLSKELTSSNSEIIALQTNLNFYRYLQIKAFLDEFSYYGDSYIQNYETANSQTAENTEKQVAVEQLTTIRNKLKTVFDSVKGKIAQNFTAPLISTEYANDDQLKALFKQELTAKLSEKSNEKASASAAADTSKNYSQTIKLVGNDGFRELIIKTDFDAMSEKDLYKFIKDINKTIVNDLSIIQEIKDKRIKWSDIINEIRLRTIAVDKYYSSDVVYNNSGGIRYTSYAFDANGPTITISGETKRIDSLNFSMITNLIDELNRSEFFENAEMRSFSKSGSLETGYTASLQLSMNLKKPNQ